MQLAAVWLALPTLLAIWNQTYQNNRIQRYRAYHDYFGEFPTTDKRQKMADLFETTKIPFPSMKAPLSQEQLQLVLAVPGANNTINQYLNDFEEFSIAVSRGVVCQDYAYDIEGSRVIGVYFGFRTWIEHIREHDGMSFSLNGGGKAVFKPRSFSALNDLAVAWTVCRLEEDGRSSVAELQRSLSDGLSG